MAVSNLQLNYTTMYSVFDDMHIKKRDDNILAGNVDCIARILCMFEGANQSDAINHYSGQLGQVVITNGNTITAAETSNADKFIELFGSNSIAFRIDGSTVFGGKEFNTYWGLYYWNNGVDKTKTSLIDDTIKETSPLIVSNNVSNIIGGFDSKGCIDLSNNTLSQLAYSDQVIGDVCTQTPAPFTGYADFRSGTASDNKARVISIINKILEEDNPFYYNRLKSTITYSGTLDKNSGILQLYFQTDSEITFGKTPPTDLVHTVYEWFNDVTQSILPINNGLKVGDETWYRVFIAAYDNDITNPTNPINGELLLEFPHTLSKMKLHGFPVLSFVRNTDAFKDYINQINTSTTNFKYVLWLQSFNRHYTIRWVQDILGWKAFQDIVDTINGTTNAVDYGLTNSIQMGVSIPLSNSDSDDNITLHTLPTTIERLNVVYRYREPLEDDLGEPYNQPSTPTSPSYDSDPPEKVTPTNPQGDVPFGTIIDSMLPQPIEPTLNPLLSVDALYTIYKVSLMDIPKIAHFLFNTTWYENLLQINNNPMEHILSFKVSVFDLDSDKNEQIKLVNIPMEYTPFGGTKVVVNGDVIERNAIYTIGQFTITPKYNSFLDITMSDYQLYLPFVGYVDLDPNVVLNYQLTLKVYVDALTLLAKYQLTRDEDNLIVGEWEFNSSYDLPLSASNKAQAELSMIGSLATSVVSVFSGNPMGIVGGLAGALMTKYHTSTQGSPSANLSFLTSRQAYIKITRPMWQDIQNFNHTHGRVLNANRRLGDCNGFTKVASGTDFSGLNITGRELDMVKNALQEGIII